MTPSINRRDFLKISGAMIITAGLAGSGLRYFTKDDRSHAQGSSSGLAPNVILIILDTVRAKSMSLYGYERPTTPNLERIAKQGVSFNHAIAPASCASWIISLAGLIVPRTFDMWVNETSFGRRSRRFL